MMLLTQPYQRSQCREMMSLQPLISRFMKEIFKGRPPVPRYGSTWDIQPMLSHLMSFRSVKEIDLKSLTHDDCSRVGTKRSEHSLTGLKIYETE